MPLYELPGGTCEGACARLEARTGKVMPDIQETLDTILDKPEVLRGLKELVNARLSYCTERKQLKV